MHLIAFICISAALSTTIRTHAAVPPPSPVKVLLVGNQQEQNVIEEASSLSLDLPVARNQQPADQDSSSPGYKQNPLASLQLHLREATNDTSQRFGAERYHRAAVPFDSSTSADPKLPWSEISLPKIRPTWLNVSQKFRINGSSFDELDYMIPTQYLLRPAFDSPILLKTKLGIVEGVRSIMFNKYIYTFLSVPYAKAPVEELRFKAPQPIEKWNGILQTTKWPPFCVQPSITLASRNSPVHVLSQIMSEDCLYMNIWTPSLKINRHHKRPVMVWIHGGAFQYGGISVDENDASALASMGDVVVVTFNYRLNAFGFLNAANHVNGPNNVGLLDQQMALKWVQENIKQFGGDPTQVTLFGESAGGHSVGLHMISPASFPLFKRAILQSGVPISFMRSYDVNPDNTFQTAFGNSVSAVMMAKRLKCMTEKSDDATAASTTSSVNDIATTEQSAAAPTTTTTAESDDANGNSSNTDDEAPILDDATLECLRKKSSIELLRSMGIPGSSGFFPTGNDIKGFFPNGPVGNSYDPEELKIGPQKDFLIGTNTDEGTFLLHYMSSKLFPADKLPRVADLQQFKDKLFSELEKHVKMPPIHDPKKPDSIIVTEEREMSHGGQAHLLKPLLKTSSNLLERFMPKPEVKVLANGTVIGNTTEYSKEGAFGRSMGNFISDVIFHCPARALSRTLNNAGRNVYYYMFGHRSKLSHWHDWMGVTHHDEVEFVFGRPLRLSDVFEGRDIDMSQRLIKTWSHFAYTGQLLDQFNIKWPKYGDESYFMNMRSDGASIGQMYHDKMCTIYDNIIVPHLKDN